MIDHGLYIEESPKFRQEYCNFWKGILLMRQDLIKSVCKNWGIKDQEMFASMTIMKPYSTNKAVHLQGTTRSEILKMQERMTDEKQSVKDLLEDTRLIPRELIFVGRSLNLIRANNKETGSSVNRIKIMGDAAVRGSQQQWNLFERFNYQFQLSSISFVFYLSKLWASFNHLFGNPIQSIEEQIPNSMQQMGFQFNVDEQQ